MLRHLIALSIEHQARGNHVLEGDAVEHHRGNGMQGEEPATRLIHTFIDEVGREGISLVDGIAMLERIVNLCVRHRTRIEPNVDQVSLALHRLTRLAHQYDIIYIRTVKVYLVIVFLSVVARNESLLFQRIACHDASSHTLLYLCIELFE